MKSIAKPLLFVASGFFALNGCKEEGPNTTKLQYMPDMADSPAVKAQESYIDPPENSVTINAILYPENKQVAEQELRNPFGEGAAVGPELIDRGKKLYNTYCYLCHGYDGKGKGTLGDAYPIPVPDLTTPDYQARKDGFYFAQISLGGNMMPAYAHATSPHERWWIVSYLRTLQGAGGEQQPSPATPAPSPAPQTQP